MNEHNSFHKSTQIIIADIHDAKINHETIVNFNVHAPQTPAPVAYY